jgi:hypothetical protein
LVDLGFNLKLFESQIFNVFFFFVVVCCCCCCWTNTDRSMRRGVAAAAAIVAVGVTVDFFDRRARPPLDQHKYFPYRTTQTKSNENEH